MKKENKITLSNSKKKDSYDVLFIMKKEDYDYIVYTDNVTKETVYFGKSKQGSNKIVKVTSEEKVMLENVLKKFESNQKESKDE